LEEFLKEKGSDLGSAVYEVEHFVETAKSNLLWMSSSKMDVIEWLKDKVTTSSTTTSRPTPSTSGSRLITAAWWSSLSVAFTSRMKCVFSKINLMKCGCL